MTTFTLLFTTIPFLVFTTNDPSILGTWKAADLENSIIEVYEDKDGFLYGKIIESDKKEWINEVILKKVKYAPKDKVWMGEIYSLKRKMTVKVTISLESNKKLKLIGKKFFMTKTFYWEK